MRPYHTHRFKCLLIVLHTNLPMQLQQRPCWHYRIMRSVLAIDSCFYGGTLGADHRLWYRLILLNIFAEHKKAPYKIENRHIIRTKTRIRSIEYNNIVYFEWAENTFCTILCQWGSFCSWFSIFWGQLHGHKNHAGKCVSMEIWFILLCNNIAILLTAVSLA